MVDFIRDKRQEGVPETLIRDAAGIFLCQAGCFSRYDEDGRQNEWRGNFRRGTDEALPMLKADPTPDSWHMIRR